MSDLPDKWPHSIREINDLPTPQRHAVYRTMIPTWIFEKFGIDPQTGMLDGVAVVDYVAIPGSRSFELSLFHKVGAVEPTLYIHMADSLMSQLMVLLVVMNDPEAPRYYIDVMPDGRQTNLGTSMRNIPEEIRALNAGLAPGQVRQGLRGFRRAVPYFEDFVAKLGHDIFMIEPLSYHNAIVFERYGFGYMYGRKEMERIHREFQPGGDLHTLLYGDTPFRQRDAWQSIRGRSWAIHDGILGHPFTGFQMVKRIGKSANANTFPDGVW